MTVPNAAGRPPRDVRPQGPSRRRLASLAAVLVVYACVQSFYITATPLQTLTLPDNMPQGGPQTLLVGIGPDEKEHFLYIRSLADQGVLPAPDPPRRASARQYVTYQAQHPPLFYALAALVYKAAAGLPPGAVWYLLRALCAVCGGVVIVLAAEAARLSFPDRTFLVLAAAPAVAFLPMFGYMTGSLSNEPLEMVFGAAAWLHLVRLARERSPYSVLSGVLLGLTLGLAALTRLTALLWLPAVAVVLAYCARRAVRSGGTRFSALLPPLACALCFALPPAPWLIHNRLAFGSLLVRVYSRPLIGSETLLQFLFDPGLPAAALLTALFYSSTSWFPFWLTRSVLPGGTAATRAWQSLFLALDGFVALSLFLGRRRARRAGEPPDGPGRTLLWAAGCAVAFCVLTLVQQQVYVDWQVMYYAGRYAVAAVPAGALLLLVAGCAWVPRTGRAPRIAAALLAALLLAFDVSTVVLVRQFYASHPGQADLQRLY